MNKLRPRASNANEEGERERLRGNTTRWRNKYICREESERGGVRQYATELVGRKK